MPTRGWEFTPLFHNLSIVLSIPNPEVRSYVPKSVVSFHLVTLLHVNSASQLLAFVFLCNLQGSVWVGGGIPRASSSELSIIRINKISGAFFSHGELGAFHGLLNPLSSLCVIKCCMYGSESRVINSTLLSKLESFQAELGKQILKLLKHTLKQHRSSIGPQCSPGFCVVKLAFLWATQPNLSAPRSSMLQPLTSCP